MSFAFAVLLGKECVWGVLGDDTNKNNFRDHQELSFPRAHLIFNAILPVKKESIWQMKNLRLRKESA